MSDRNKAVVRRLIEEHWNGKNAAMVEELFENGVTIHTPDGVLTGFDGARYLLDAYETAFPDFHIAIEDLIAEGDQVVVRYTFTGTHRGALADIPSTGLRVTVPNGVLIYRLSSGKVSEGFFLWNKYSLLQQIRVLPAAASAGA